MNHSFLSVHKKYIDMSKLEASSNYESEQQNAWRSLAFEFERLNNDYGASIAEMAQGLQISRQRLYDFLRSPERGMSICRADLIRLWDVLTDSDKMASRKLSTENRHKRKELRKQGPDRLLLSVGFLPHSKSYEEVNMIKERSLFTAFINFQNEQGDVERLQVGYAVPISSHSLNLRLEKLTFPFDGWIYLTESEQEKA